MTGTLVQGKTAISVTTADTKSGGVTSYMRFNGVTYGIDFHLKSSLEIHPLFDAKSSGFPRKKKITRIINYREHFTISKL